MFVPAVSKWETGATYPDVELLPALARVLKTDVNTLLCFRMELSDTEVELFLTKVFEAALSEGIEEAFRLAEQKIKEYPTDIDMLSALLTPWDVYDCPIYRHMEKGKNNDKHEMASGTKMLTNILDELEKMESHLF